MVFDLVGGDTEKRSFLVLKEGGHLVAATQPVSKEETAMHRVSGLMMRLAPSGERLGRMGQLLEEGTIRPDVATVYALEDAAQAWKDIAGNLPLVHGMLASVPRPARRKSHGKILLRVASEGENNGYDSHLRSNMRRDSRNDARQRSNHRNAHHTAEGNVS